MHVYARAHVHLPRTRARVHGHARTQELNRKAQNGAAEPRARIEGLAASLAASKKEGASLQAALEGARAAGSKLEVQLAAASERFARQVRVRMRRVRMRQGHARHAACASS